jgi:hypothetical protein
MQVEADEDVILAVDASKIHVFDPESEKIICHASEGSEVE